MEITFRICFFFLVSKKIQVMYTVIVVYVQAVYTEVRVSQTLYCH